MEEYKPLDNAVNYQKNGDHKLLKEITEKVKQASARFSMICNGDRILVGFSGGSDSALMLSVLSSFPDIQIGALHVHHGIRGDEADRDEAFCRKFCDDRNIPYYCVKVDVPSLAAQNRTGIEETARQVRYDAFDKIACENGYNKIATAHNASDNTETVLFHLIRGTSLEGLCGIPPVRDNIIRPLILCSKDEIQSCCDEENIPYVTDSTNSDTAYSRNFLRCEIIPKLKTLNPSLDMAISSECDCLRADRDFILSNLDDYSLKSGRTVLSALPDSVLLRVLKAEFEKCGLSPTYVHLKKSAELLRSDKPNFKVSVTGGTFVCDRDILSCGEEITSLREQHLYYGENILSDGSMLYIGKPDEDCGKYINKLKNVYKLSIHTVVCSDKIVNMTLRSRLAGDACTIGNMTKKVRKMIQELKLTANERARVPVILSGDEIIWVAGFPVCDGAKPTDKANTAHIFYFKDKI